jgi:D-alanyl-D-alanine carboxypeptidase
VTLVAAAPAKRTVRVDRMLTERVVAPTVVSLPVRKGQQLGRVQVYAGRKLIAGSPLVAARSIPKPGFLGRTGWYTRRTLHHIGGWFS